MTEYQIRWRSLSGRLAKTSDDGNIVHYDKWTITADDTKQALYDLLEHVRFERRGDHWEVRLKEPVLPQTGEIVFATDFADKTHYAPSTEFLDIKGSSEERAKSDFAAQVSLREDNWQPENDKYAWWVDWPEGELLVKTKADAVTQSGRIESRTEYKRVFCSGTTRMNAAENLVQQLHFTRFTPEEEGMYFGINDDIHRKAKEDRIQELGGKEAFWENG